MYASLGQVRRRQKVNFDTYLHLDASRPGIFLVLMQAARDDSHADLREASPCLTLDLRGQCGYRQTLPQRTQ